MDEKIAKYIKTYGVLAGFIAVIVLLGELRLVFLLRALIAMVSLLLVGVVLIQQGKGGGLVGALGGMSGDTMFGTTATPVKKFTAAVGIIFIIGVLVLGRAERDATRARAEAAKERSAPMQEAPTPAPSTPAPIPVSPSPAPK